MRSRHKNELGLGSTVFHTDLFSLSRLSGSLEQASRKYEEDVVLNFRKS